MRFFRPAIRYSALTAFLACAYGLADMPQAHADSIPPQIAYLKNKLHGRLTYIGPVGASSENPDGYPTYIVELNTKRFTVSLLKGGMTSVGVILDQNGRNVTVEAVAKEEAALSTAMKQVNEVIGQADQTAGTLSQSAVTENQQPTAPPHVGSDPMPVDMTQFLSKTVTPDALHDDLTKTARVVVGNRNLPHVVIVADPQCPFCHIAWSQLKPYVDAKKIAVEIVLADTNMDHPAGVRPSSSDDIVQLLANPEIDKLWMSGAGSTDAGVIPHATTVGTPAFNEADHYRNDLNDPFALKYRDAFAGSKRGLPVMMYISKDGKQVYGREGVKTPEDMRDFLSDIL